MNILMKIAPHAAILIGNMYYVFWGIDRVNNAMNFIDNPYTKFLLVILITCSGLNDWRLTRITLVKLRRTNNPTPIYVRLGVIALNMLLAAVILLLLVIDLFNEDLLLFLSEFVKAMILILSITSLLNSLQLTARARAVIREENRRRAQMRRQPQSRPNAPQRRPAPRPQQPRYDGGYARPQSGRYDDFRPQPVRPRPQQTRHNDGYARPQQRPAGRTAPSSGSRPANRY